MKKLLYILAIMLALAFLIKNRDDLPVVAIANYGPHSSLEATIKGLKEQLEQDGYIDVKTIRYEIADVGFDHGLIPSVINNLARKSSPKVLVALATPLAQFAKSQVHNVPIVFAAVTDPVDAGLIKNANQPDGNMTGSSEQQDLIAFLQFAKTVLPNATRVGMLYSSSDRNDIALLNMMQSAVDAEHMTVVAIPVENIRDVPIRVQQFKEKVDLIYVGTSGPIQPAIPAIAAEAEKMRIPVFNADFQAVRDGLALASFGVSYESVGRNAGKLVVALLGGSKVNDLPPIYPTISDHHALINKKLAAKLGINIPLNIEVVE